MDIWSILKIWGLTNFVVFNSAFCILVLLILFTRLIPSVRINQFFNLAARLIPVFFIGITILLLADNFTYTLFRVGIVRASGIDRGLYGVGFLMLLFQIYRKIFPSLKKKPQNSKKILQIWIPIFILLLSLLITILNIPQEFNTHTLVDTGEVTVKPNIILLGSDGISAKNMSIYGYSRDTTPYLKKLSSESLLMKNNFSNSGKTPGSVASLLTGKLPTKTRVSFPPDILRSIDAYQHLPGILKELGYKSVEIAVPYFLDATEMNFLYGFDRVNNKLIDNGPLTHTIRAVFSNDTVFFLEAIYERIFDRLCNIFYIHQMDNPYAIVTEPSDPGEDEKRLTQLDELINEGDQPIFVHIHLIGTHGVSFHTRSKQFSKGKVQDKDWMTDFYDDSILDFDQYVNQVVNILDHANKLDNTILIIYTDHAQRWDPLERIPLMIHFPDGEYAGTIIEIFKIWISPRQFWIT